MNDGINSNLCSLKYTLVDEVADIVARLMGRGTLLAKIDIEAAYRIIPVQPQDIILQAVEWNNRIYMDLMLPFGLQSAPKIFNAIADALEWILHQQGINTTSMVYRCGAAKHWKCWTRYATGWECQWQSIKGRARQHVSRSYA